MFVERLTFQAKYGQGDTLVDLFREWAGSFEKQLGVGIARVYTDASGPMFTISVDQEFGGIEAYAAFMAGRGGIFADPAFTNWFGRMQAVVDHGRRELFNLEALEIA